MFWRFIQLLGAEAGFFLGAVCAGAALVEVMSDHPDGRLAGKLIAAAVFLFGTALGTLVQYLGSKLDQLREAIESKEKQESK